MTRPTDLVCFSHLRWGFVFQRPNHLISRAARSRRTFFWEEPRYDAPEGKPVLDIQQIEPSLSVCTPRIPAGREGEADAIQRTLLQGLFQQRRISPEVLWYYTPMALSFTRGLHSSLVLYDCMDQLSAFAGAPPELPILESELFRRADLVFTGGQSLYEAKRNLHWNIHPFPSSVDAAHFAAARNGAVEPADQTSIPHPRIGFFGVIDERIDLKLIAQAAEERPEWQYVLLGPIAKIDPSRLPRRSNIHWLGRKDYASLPGYLSGWDVAMMPFALNESTAFISPTKTLEYMAAGKPVVSTAIADVVEPYGRRGAVRIADRQGFVRAIEDALARDRSEVMRDADEWVAQTSWDRTWRQMDELVRRTLAVKWGSSERAEESCSTS